MKVLFKLETKVGACELFSASSVPRTIASPPGDLRKKKKQKQKTFTHNNCQLTL